MSGRHGMERRAALGRTGGGRDADDLTTSVRPMTAREFFAILWPYFWPRHWKERLAVMAWYVSILLHMHVL